MGMWQYATLSQKERKDMIKNGNKDVYDAEIKRCNSLIDSRKELGLDTKDVENWKHIVGQARDDYETRVRGERYKVTRNANTPTFYSASQSKVLNDFSKFVKNLVSEYNQNLSEAVNKANVEKNELNEWLASNGLSSKGKTATDTAAVIENQLKESMDKLKSKFDESYKSAVESLKKAF